MAEKKELFKLSDSLAESDDDKKKRREDWWQLWQEKLCADQLRSECFTKAKDWDEAIGCDMKFEPLSPWEEMADMLQAARGQTTLADVAAVLLEVLDRMLAQEGVSVAFGGEVDDPGLRHCALVATRYGADESPLGALGVIGPSRMDYARVIPLVEFLSRAITEKLGA